MRILTLIVCWVLLIQFTLAERIIQDSNLTIGSGTAGDVTIKANQGDANPPKLKFDDTANKWKKSDNGTSFLNVGDVEGPSSVTDNRIPKFEGTTGKEVIESGVDISDTNVMTGLGGITSAGTVNASGLLVLSSDSTNTQSGTNVNINATASSIIRLAGTPLTSVGGYNSTTSGRYTILVNETGSSLTINNLDGLVTATNQIRTGTGADYTMVNGTSVTLLYNATTQKHHIVSTSPITAGALPVLTKGQLVTHNGTSVVAANACADGEMIEWNSAETNGFKCIKKVPDLTKGQLITHNGTTYVAANACADGEMIEWDSTQTNGFKCVTKPLIKKYIQRMETVGAGTWIRSSANVKKVEFYYCGGGGAGGGAAVTAAGQLSTGAGGSVGTFNKCTVYNPPSTISYSIGAGGTPVAGGAGGNGGGTFLSAVGCNPTVGQGGALGVASTAFFAYNVQSIFTASCLINSQDTLSCISELGTPTATLRSPADNYAVSGAGTGLLSPIPEMFTDAGPPRNSSGNGTQASADSCGGGGGAANTASQATARAGGAGGSGQIVSYEYE